MKGKKEFDCVDMKWVIQKRIREQYAGIQEGKARQMQWEEALADPILGPFLTKVQALALAKQEIQ